MFSTRPLPNASAFSSPKEYAESLPSSSNSSPFKVVEKTNQPVSIKVERALKKQDFAMKLRAAFPIGGATEVGINSAREGSFLQKSFVEKYSGTEVDVIIPAEVTCKPFEATILGRREGSELKVTIWKKESHILVTPLSEADKNFNLL